MGPLGVAPSEPRFAPEVTGAAVVALHNLAVHRLLPSPADAVLNVVTAAGLTAFARRASCSHDDLGTCAADAAAGLRLGLAAAAVATGGIVLGAFLPATRPFFRDRRVIDVGRREAIYHLAVRIPLATAIAEELTFAAPARPGPATLARRRGMDLAGLRRLARPSDLAALRRQSGQRPGRRPSQGAVGHHARNDAVHGRRRLPVRLAVAASRSLLAPSSPTPPAMPRPTWQADGWFATSQDPAERTAGCT
jgi:hypothetical protein